MTYRVGYTIHVCLCQKRKQNTDEIVIKFL